jgi:hypothetical protein
MNLRKKALSYITPVILFAMTRGSPRYRSSPGSLSRIIAVWVVLPLVRTISLCCRIEVDYARLKVRIKKDVDPSESRV